MVAFDNFRATRDGRAGASTPVGFDQLRIPPAVALGCGLIDALLEPRDDTGGSTRMSRSQSSNLNLPLSEALRDDQIECADDRVERCSDRRRPRFCLARRILGRDVP